MAKVAIVGSRDFLRTHKVIEFVNSLLPEDIIVSGGAVGVDSWAEAAANTRGMETLIFKPEYSKYQNGATFIRNKQIVDASDYVVAFWDGKSHGTQHTISVAIRAGKRVLIIGPNDKEEGFGNGTGGRQVQS